MNPRRGRSTLSSTIIAPCGGGGCCSPQKAKEPSRDVGNPRRKRAHFLGENGPTQALFITASSRGQARGWQVDVRRTATSPCGRLGFKRACRLKPQRLATLRASVLSPAGFRTRAGSWFVDRCSGSIADWMCMTSEDMKPPADSRRNPRVVGRCGISVIVQDDAEAAVPGDSALLLSPNSSKLKVSSASFLVSPLTSTLIVGLLAGVDGQRADLGDAIHVLILNGPHERDGERVRRRRDRDKLGLPRCIPKPAGAAPDRVSAHGRSLRGESARKAGVKLLPGGCGEHQPSRDSTRARVKERPLGPRESAQIRGLA